MELIIKRFTELTLEELYAILSCRQEIFVEEQKINYNDTDYLDQDSTHLFLKNKEEIVSYLRIIDPGVKYRETSIGRVLTMPDYRREGLSRRLMELAIQEVRSRNEMPIRIEAQEYLVKFYESLGFMPISDSFILEGIPHVSMLLPE